MGKRIVIALGGNALGSNLPEQMAAVKQTAKAIADLIEEGHEVVIAHGNGPQVGMIQAAMTELTRSDPEKHMDLDLYRFAILMHVVHIQVEKLVKLIIQKHI